MASGSKIAILLGASGLVGGSLLSILLQSSEYSQVLVFARRALDFVHPKLIVHTIDFEQPDTYANKVKGDVLFCCLGTTISKAGSKEAFRKVDYTYPSMFAEIAKRNGVKHYLLVSSIGADAQSSVFYLKTKGECENQLKTIDFDTLSVFRPASLMGDRKEFRLSEKLTLPLLRAMSFLLVGKLRKYRPIQAIKVAQAMFVVANRDKIGVEVVESDQIEKIFSSKI